MKSAFLRASAVALCAAPLAAHACATCGCALSSDAAMGYATSAGWRLSLEYDFINQNQLRNGRASVPASQVAAINDAGGDQEVEKGTINRYLTAGLTYSPSASWNVTALVPYIDRTHTTYGSATSDQLTPDNVSQARSNGLGDIKLIGAWQGFLPTHNPRRAAGRSSCPRAAMAGKTSTPAPRSAGPLPCSPRGPSPATPWTPA